MKNIFFICCMFLLSNIYSQNGIIGKWKTIDDETGKPKSIVEIYEKSGKIYGKINHIIETEHRNRVCEKCEGDDKNKPILGMVIIRGLTKDGTEYSGGKIIDPKNGKSYRCLIALESASKLKVRGYIGFSLFGRSQHWTRVDDSKNN